MSNPMYNLPIPMGRNGMSVDDQERKAQEIKGFFEQWQDRLPAADMRALAIKLNASADKADKKAAATGKSTFSSSRVKGFGDIDLRFLLAWIERGLPNWKFSDLQTVFKRPEHVLAYLQELGMREGEEPPIDAKGKITEEACAERVKILLLQDPKCGYKLRKIAIAKNVNVTHVPEISAEHKLRAKAMKQAAQVLDSESESDVGNNRTEAIKDMSDAEQSEADAEMLSPPDNTNKAPKAVRSRTNRRAPAQKEVADSQQPAFVEPQSLFKTTAKKVKDKDGNPYYAETTANDPNAIPVIVKGAKKPAAAAAKKPAAPEATKEPAEELTLMQKMAQCQALGLSDVEIMKLLAPDKERGSSTRLASNRDAAASSSSNSTSLSSKPVKPPPKKNEVATPTVIALPNAPDPKSGTQPVTKDTEAKDDLTKKQKAAITREANKRAKKEELAAALKKKEEEQQALEKEMKEIEAAALAEGEVDDGWEEALEKEFDSTLKEDPELAKGLKDEIKKDQEKVETGAEVTVPGGLNDKDLFDENFVVTDPGKDPVTEENEKSVGLPIASQDNKDEEEKPEVAAAEEEAEPMEVDATPA